MVDEVGIEPTCYEVKAHRGCQQPTYSSIKSGSSGRNRTYVAVIQSHSGIPATHT